jgi:murein DD-endopeptidase MepM/ murein hydrolase activator NlpD
MKQIVILIIVVYCQVASAQFNTITMNRGIVKERVENTDPQPTVASEVSDVGDTAAIIQRYMSVSYPLDNIVVTSPFGNRFDPFSGKVAQHKGVDLRAHFQRVYAMLPGVIVKVGSESNGGNFVCIRHGDYMATYCHLSQILVHKGDAVKAGDIVAVSGDSGQRCHGAHLHYSLKYKGKIVNPMCLLDYVRQVRAEALNALTSGYSRWLQSINGIAP